MVRVVELDQDGREVPAHHLTAGDDEETTRSGTVVERPNPNFLLPSAAALSCYPITSQLATYLDLNTLHDLSRTCRQFRANLLQYRDLLMRRSLRCENENANPARRLGSALNASFAQWSAYARTGESISRISGGRVGACARDMVGECRRCSAIVCRNCTLKAPSATAVKGRFRRLCRTCMKSPLDLLTVVTDRVGSDEGTVSQVYTRDPCTCDHIVWICQPCGHALRNADVVYVRGWSWRNRYSDCGGIGAGLGEGNEGVQCGRGGECLDSRVVENEIECDASELAAIEAEMFRAKLDGHEWAGSSYTTHEIVGIGGKVKKKLTQAVLVGSTVKEYENERTTGKFLQREQEGLNRSWCSWCNRVVPGKKDLDRSTISVESSASQSSVSL